MTLELAHADWGGSGEAVLVMHGLFGAGQNWRRVGRLLTDRWRVIGVHLRNHGASPWSPSMTYDDMARDVLALLDRLEIDACNLVGHSMGGKVGMVAALRAPECVRRLGVIDIAPVPYDHDHRLEIDAMRGLDVASIASRQEADAALAATIDDASLRAFLLQNLESANGGYRWRVNLEGIDAHMAELTDFPADVDLPFEGPCLLLAAGRSDYVDERGRSAMQALFPRTTFVNWPEQGHWPHVERPDDLARLLRDLLDKPS